MKIYTLEYNCNTPTIQKINVPTNTDYMVGVKVIKNGEVQDIDPTDMKLGGVAADEAKTNGYVTFTKSAGAGAVYSQDVVAIDADDLKVNFTLITNIYKSQVGDLDMVGGTGGVTEQWVQDYVSAETSAFVDDTELGTVLEAYPTTSAMTSAIESATSTFVSASDVAAAISTATSAFVSASDVATAISASLVGYATTSYVDAQIGAVLSQSF